MSAQQKDLGRIQKWFKAALKDQQLGRPALAEKTYLKILKVQPRHAGVLVNLAIVQGRQGKLEKARESALRATTTDPKLAAGHTVLGAAFIQLGQFAAAIKACRVALSLNQTDQSVLPMMGAAYKALGQFCDAEKCFRQVLGDTITDISAVGNLSSVLVDQGKYQEAKTLLDQQINKTPNVASLWNTLGNIHSSLADHDAAMAAYQQAITIDRFFPDALYNLSLLHLVAGQLSKAWPGFEKRLDLFGNDQTFNSFKQAQWDGMPVTDGCLLICAEQGLGDTLQFIRYAVLAKKRVGRIILICQPPLKNYLKRMEELDAVVAFGDPLPDFDFYIPILSLPQIFTPDLPSIPNLIPYLPIPDITKGEPGKTIKVGLNWAGSETNPNDHRRSTTLDVFKPLLDIPNCRFFSLQFGGRGNDIKDLGLSTVIEDLRPQLDGFKNTADTIQTLDLVISVCTSLAHLTGGIGRPVWVLLNHDADWRWFKNRDDSPWYPTARLFRQPTPGDWQDVIRNVHQALSTLTL